MKVFFMRHGQTNYNVLGLCNDDSRDDVHLTQLGVQQAEAAAEQLREVPLRRIFVSELPRTRQTAAIVNRYHNVDITTHPGVNDIRSGFNNRPVAEYFAAIAHDPFDACPNGGESLREYKRRVLKFVEWLRLQPMDNPLLVVAHEETLRVFAAFAYGYDDERMRQLSFLNCEFFVVDFV